MTESPSSKPSLWVVAVIATVALAVVLVLLDTLSAGAKRAAIDIDALSVPADAEAEARGEVAFGRHCVACHGPTGHGGTGPSLVDDAWLHGADDAALLRSIAAGIPERGMPGWAGVIGGDGVQDVAAYVRALSAAEGSGE